MCNITRVGGGELLISWGKDQTTNCHFFLIQLCTKKIRFPSSPLMVLSQSRAEGFKSKPALKDHLPSEICHTFKLLTLRGCVCDTVLRSCITLDFFSFCGCVCDVFKILQNSALVWMCL